MDCLHTLVSVVSSEAAAARLKTINIVPEYPYAGATIKDVAEEQNLDWHTVKRLEKQYMREQLERSGQPRAKVILLAANKRLNTAYPLKESFGQLWGYNSEVWARRFFGSWRAQLRGRSEQQDPRHPAPSRRVARRGIPQAQGLDLYASSYLIKK